MKLITSIQKLLAQCYLPETNINGVILNVTLTGLQTPNGKEVRILIHVQPLENRSYLLEYHGILNDKEIANYLHPGQKVLLGLKGKYNVRRLQFSPDT